MRAIGFAPAPLSGGHAVVTSAACHLMLFNDVAMRSREKRKHPIT
jgi:hypothetical protein